MPGTKVAEVLNVERLKFIILVSESDLNIMKEGSKVNIKTDAYPLNTYTGKVAHISYKADKSKKYKVTIEVSNDKNNPLRAGMFGKATFNENNQSQSAIVIPRRSVIGSLKDAQVYVVDGNKVTLKNITVGAKLDDGIVVLKGLKVGERVVTNGQINLKDGVEIRIAD
jgi:RND family efflux transporter MFP subunit